MNKIVASLSISSVFSSDFSDQQKSSCLDIPRTRIHLKETWLNAFILLQVSMSFSTSIFSTGIKLYIWHPVVVFGILILSEQFDGFVQLPPWRILKDRQVCVHKYVKYSVLSPIIAQVKQIKIQDMTMTRIRLLL